MVDLRRITTEETDMQGVKSKGNQKVKGKGKKKNSVPGIKKGQ
jgi:hypothetical protein